MPKLGHKARLRGFVDPDLLQYDEVWAAVGAWHDDFVIEPHKLVEASEGLVADLKRGRRSVPQMRISMVTVVVPGYDDAIDFYVRRLGFTLEEDSPSLTADGRPKRWVVVSPGGEGTALLLAQADGDTQTAAVGRQTGGRVGFFLQVDDFDAHFRRFTDNGVQFLEGPRDEVYGRVAVFVDHIGNRWDLLGPPPS